MFMIAMPNEFTVGQTADCRIDGKPERLTWRDEDTLVIEPGNARKIFSVQRTDDLIHFACGALSTAQTDYAVGGPVLYQRAKTPEPHPSEEEVLSVMSQQLPLEVWDEDRTPLRRWLFLDATSYRPAPVFDLPAAQPDRLEENFLASPKGSFAYQNRVLPAGWPLLHQGQVGMTVFNGDVVIPMLIDMKVRCRTGEPFSAGTEQGFRMKWGAAWMSLTPSEMLTQRPGVLKAQGKVVIGGLGLGWLLRKVCEKESVEQVIVVEKSRELLDWYGYDLCKRHPKVSNVIFDDIYNQMGKHGGKTSYLLDIWLLYSDAQKDHRLRSWRRKLKKRLWAWGL